jgi:transcription initiation factor IIF auxiliary subunit
VVEIEQPPFSIIRNGWGEFDIGVTIYFRDINEEPVNKVHMLRIFHFKTTQKATLKKPVVNETYDEIVFCEPTEFFYHMLTDEIAPVPSTAPIAPPAPVEDSKSAAKEEGEGSAKEADDKMDEDEPENDEKSVKSKHDDQDEKDEPKETPVQDAEMEPEEQPDAQPEDKPEGEDQDVAEDQKDVQPTNENGEECEISQCLIHKYS